MRKLFVALLILSVMGGAFAQDDDEVKGVGKWGTFGGSAEFSTKLQMGVGIDDSKEGNSLVFKGENMRVGKDGADFKLNLQWDYVKGDWSIVVPFTINKNGISTLNWDGGWDGKSAKVIYNPEGPLNVEIPFAFVIDDDFNLLSSSFLSAKWFNDHQKVGNGMAIKATYTEDNYEFGASYDSIIRKHSDGENPFDPAKVWGKYKFMDGNLTVAAAYKGGIDTGWWRVSDIALGNVDFSYKNTEHTDLSRNFDGNYGNNGENTDNTNILTGMFGESAVEPDWNALTGAGFGASRLGWEHKARNFANIDKGGGLAIRYDLSDNLNFGIAFRDNEGSANLFYDGAPKARNFLEDFLLTPVIGVGFDSGSGLAASAVFQIDNFRKAILKSDAKTPQDIERWETAPMVHMAIGAKFTGVENLEVAADFSVFDMGKYDANEAYVNFGVTAKYVLPMGLTINFKFAGTDLGFVNMPLKDYDGKFNYTGNVTPETGTYDRPNRKGIGVEATVGYTNDLSDMTNLSVNAGLSFVHKDIWKYMNDMYTEYTKDSTTPFGNAVRAQIEPKITWKVIEGGTISLGYALGLSLDPKDPALIRNITFTTNDKGERKIDKVYTPAVYKNEIVAKFTYTFK